MTIQLQAELTETQARALSRLCVLVPFAVLERYAVDQQHAHAAFEALTKIREDLREQGMEQP